MSAEEIFATYRSNLFALAYQMLGSATDAEDVLQDAFLRYSAAPRDDVRVPKAYLSTMVTRLCLDRLKSAQMRREQYIGTWLPEPILTVESADAQHVVERHEAITQAFLVLLEALTPPERAVFLLREVFEYPYDDIAAMLQTSVANCRQLFHRAKQQLAADRPRFDASPSHQHQLVERFLAATQRGDVQELGRMLAADVRLWADSGGKAPAPRHMVQGREIVARLFAAFFVTFLQMVGGDLAAMHTMIVTVNGEPAVIAWLRERLDSVLICSFDADVITSVRIIRNPDKLTYIERQLAGQA